MYALVAAVLRCNLQVCKELIQMSMAHDWDKVYEQVCLLVRQQRLLGGNFLHLFLLSWDFEKHSTLA